MTNFDINTAGLVIVGMFIFTWAAVLVMEVRPRRREIERTAENRYRHRHRRHPLYLSPTHLLTLRIRKEPNRHPTEPRAGSPRGSRASRIKCTEDQPSAKPPRSGGEQGAHRRSAALDVLAAGQVGPAVSLG